MKAFGPTLIAIFVAYIAYRQWRTNHDSLREKLFDRRLAIYNQVHKSLARILRDGFPASGVENELFDAWMNSKFLFNNEIPEYINELRDAVHEGQCFNYDAQKDDSNRSRNQEREHEKFKWLSHQFDPIHEKFVRYLKFDN